MLVIPTEILACLELNIWNCVVGVVWFAAFHGINLAPDHDAMFANAGPYNGAILSVVIHNLRSSALNFVTGALMPLFGKSSECLELVACVESQKPLGFRTRPNDGLRTPEHHLLQWNTSTLVLILRGSTLGDLRGLVFFDISVLCQAPCTKKCLIVAYMVSCVAVSSYHLTAGIPVLRT